MKTNDNLKRIAVVGTTGSGKTTLAEGITAALKLPLTDLDTLHWMDGWQERPTEDLRRLVDQASAGERWVISGNYRVVRDLVWGRADTLVWLDYPLRVVLPRLLRRTLIRGIGKAPLWGTNNTEDWRNLFSRDKYKNLLLWAIDTHPRHRKDYPEALLQPEYKHLKLVHFTQPRQAQRWLSELAAGSFSGEETGSGIQRV